MLWSLIYSTTTTNGNNYRKIYSTEQVTLIDKFDCTAQHDQQRLRVAERELHELTDLGIMYYYETAQLSSQTVCDQIKTIEATRTDLLSSHARVGNAYL